MPGGPFISLDQQTDHKKSRDQLIEELLEAKALIKGFLGTVPGGFIVLDREWRLVYLNREALELFEGDERGLIGETYDKIYPARLGHILSPKYIRELSQAKINTVTKYSNYNSKWYKLSAFLSNFGIFIRLEDITKEMLVNRLLRLNEFSVNNAKDMVFWIKMGGRIIYANKAVSKSLGYTKKEIANMMVYDIDVSYTAQNWAEFVDKIKTAESLTYESGLRACDRSVIPVEVTCNYLYYHGDEYLMAFARDITARKKTENSLKEAKAEADLYVDLMGHDINNMNQVATGYLELALEMMQTDGRIDSEHADLISRPYEMLLNSSRLIENVRKVQRERAGEYKSSVMDMEKVLREVVNSYTHVAGRDIEIELKHDGRRYNVAANELLKDIFMNLVGNSIKHSSGPLSIKIEMTGIADNGRTYCHISVEDNGPGIPDEMKTKLLHRLKPENAKARGKGFGLYLIKQLVDDFNGKFWMEDRVPGDHTKGVRFVVMLPVVE